MQCFELKTKNGIRNFSFYFDQTEQDFFLQAIKDALYCQHSFVADDGVGYFAEIFPDDDAIELYKYTLDTTATPEATLPPKLKAANKCYVVFYVDSLAEITNFLKLLNKLPLKGGVGMKAFFAVSEVAHCQHTFGVDPSKVRTRGTCVIFVPAK